jgi:hypothetical protein
MVSAFLGGRQISCVNVAGSLRLASLLRSYLLCVMREDKPCVGRVQSEARRIGWTLGLSKSHVNCDLTPQTAAQPILDGGAPYRSASGDTKFVEEGLRAEGRLSLRWRLRALHTRPQSGIDLFASSSELNNQCPLKSPQGIAQLTC